MSHVLTTCLTLCHFPRLENLKAPVSPFSFLLTNMALTASTAAVRHQTKRENPQATRSARRVGRVVRAAARNAPPPRPGMCILLGAAASSASAAVRIAPLPLDALRL